MSWERLVLDKRRGGLGYKDLECFNQAFLAKQGWQLIQFPDSLVAQVMKAKYYPQGDFMASSLGGHPSYAWRSVWGAKKLLQEGMRWIVGNGQSIKIWVINGSLPLRHIWFNLPTLVFPRISVLAL